MATVDNFEMTEIDLEQNREDRERVDVGNNETEMMNIGEFVFNHITAESHGSLVKNIRRKVAIHSKILIKTCTIIDVTIYILFLFLSLFLLVQKSTLISLDLSWLVYLSMVTTFIDGIICIWLLKLIIEAGYEHRIYTVYIFFRFVSILVVFLLILIVSMRHIINPPSGLTSAKKDILNYYLIISLSGIILWIIYIFVSTVIYSFHLSVVKEFYRIVAIIVEAQSQYAKPKNEMEIGQGIPDVCIGMPFYERVKKGDGKEDDEEWLDLSFKDAKFEVEIELEDNSSNEKSVNLSKIKVFQCESESSGSDSYRIDLKKWVDLKPKRVSNKIPKGRRLTLENEDQLGMGRRISDQSQVWSSTKKMARISDVPIEEEEDEDKYGLDFLDDYRKSTKPIPDISFKTAFTGDADMVSSPLSKLSMKRRVSIKNVIRKQSIGFSKQIRERKFTTNEEAVDAS